MTLTRKLLDAFTHCTPSKYAVTQKDSAATYCELFSNARTITSLLVHSGIRPGDRVAIWMRKNIASVEAILGTLFSGAAYIPIDVNAPRNRVLAILDVCRPRLLLVDEITDSIQQVANQSGAVVKSISERELHDRQNEEWSTMQTYMEPNREVEIDDVAYILHTSGSTGEPKGVAHTHRSACSFIDWMKDQFCPTPEDTILSIAPFHFDLSIFDLFGTLTTGATVELLSESDSLLAPHVIRTIRRTNSSVLYAVPSALCQILEAPNSNILTESALRLVLFAGEVFPIDKLRQFRRLLPNIRMANLFGPTETNVCLYYELPSMIPENWDRIPVGKPCSNMEAFVLDESGQPTVIGRPGTLWMSGTNLMAGYYDGRKNAYLGIESLPNGGPERVFNTGDIVAIGADGNFRFYGRSDRMIKYRGYRIELGEIENVFSRHTKVRFAAAFFLHPPGQQQYIAVVIQFANEYNEHSENCIKAWSAEFLPKYMIPSRVIKIDEVPYTSTGKVDQVKLKQIAMGVLDD